MQTTELNVAGMTCDGCERSIAGALRRVEGVTEVEADFESGRVAVVCERDIERARLVQAVEDAGYEVLPDGRGTLPLLG